ncbi:MAG TPA: proline dehydrogenase family protein, partial [Acidimicrobiales bacterium]|nr:proline dehydrogenase family protein [Acidimicrobiales bacterium]
MNAVGDLEREIATVAGDLDKLTRRRRGVLRAASLNERLMGLAMADPEFKTQLFRFVDVFPATSGTSDVVDHLDQYLAQGSPPRLVRAGLGIAESLPGGKAVTARLARRTITRMARQFIVGADPHDALPGLSARWSRGIAFTVDVLGEKTVSDDDAERYAARVDELLSTLSAKASLWPANERLEHDDSGLIPRVNVSVKPTALSARYSPLTRSAGLEEAASRLRPILRRARDFGALVNFDMEHVDVKDMTLELVRGLAEEDEFAALNFGVAV